jgi:hypothetical protein
MKVINKFLTAFLLPLMIFSCAKEVIPTLALSTSQADIANFDGTIDITVTSNSAWTATVSDIWCTITPTSGSGNGVIKITASNNNSTSSRAVSMVVICKNLRETAVISQTFAQLSTNTETLAFEKEAGSLPLTVTSNTKWQVEIPSAAAWLTASATSGDGNAIVTFTAQANTLGPAKSAVVLLKYGSSQKSINVTQKKSINLPPTVPVISYPADKGTNIKTIPGFTWTASTDPENDAISYIVYYSKDNVNWTEISTAKTQVYLTSHLSENTNYSWKIKAVDAEGASVTSSVYTFSTGLKSGYAHGEYKIHQNATLGNNGACAEVLFMGDGYTAVDFQDGALFEQEIIEGIESFFSVEPYKSYRSYFKVYKQATYSTDSGATQVDKNIVKNTALSTSFNGGSSITVSTDEVFRYARMIPGVDDAKLKKMLIVVIINQNRYAGTCFMWSDGKAVALCPVSRSTTEGSKYNNIVNHEAGGHGFGGLGDEYISFAGKTLPAENKSEALSWSNNGFYANIDVTSDSTLVKWRHFFTRLGYDEKLGGRVGIFEGAYYYTFGAWRPETSSCMINNAPYYNAPSREAMVKKILKVSGYSYDLDEFIRNDIQKTPGAAVQAFTKSVNPLLFVPLAPPVLMR